MAALPQTEAQFQDAVIEAMRFHGWICAHFRPARTERGWRTPVQADGEGFPDLIALRDGRQLVVEFKREGKQPTLAQEKWLAAFEEVERKAGYAPGPTVEVFQWDVRDWPEIERVIR